MDEDNFDSFESFCHDLIDNDDLDSFESFFPELNLENDDLQLIISVKKDYSSIKSIESRKKEFINDLKEFIDEFENTPESIEFMKYYDD